jgi:hypothetical protein
MSNEITMNALVAKRAEILFEIGEAEKTIARLQTELVHLDAVLRMQRKGKVEKIGRGRALRWWLVN